MNYRRKLQAGLVKPFRSKPYLDWVKSLECCGCGAPADDAHHIIDSGFGGGMGTKPSDFQTIPLCRGCHTNLHENVKVWESIHGSQSFFVCLIHEQAREEGVIDV